VFPHRRSAGPDQPEEIMELSSLLRRASLVAAPATVLALLLAVAAGVTGGDRVESSPFALASSAAVLVALLGIGALAVATLGILRAAGRSGRGPAIAVVGAVLVAGGQWASLFVLPGLSAKAPYLLGSGALTGVTIGFVASYAILAVGWATTAVALVRLHVLPAWLGVLLAIGGLAGLVPAPEPARLLILSVAVWLAARRLGATVPATRQERSSSSRL
jgi:hypothetical protein